jgi:hypothetical protein
VTHTSKTTLFRTAKFIEDELEERELAKELIDCLPVPIEMEEDKFCKLCGNTMYEGIKAARTDVQSNGKKRAQGKLH